MVVGRRRKQLFVSSSTRLDSVRVCSRPLSKEGCVWAEEGGGCGWVGGWVEGGGGREGERERGREGERERGGGWLVGCCGIVQSRGGVLRKLTGRNPKDGGWLAEPIWQAVCPRAASVDVVKAATVVGWEWCDVVHELERDVLGVGQHPEWQDSHESK